MKELQNAFSAVSLFTGAGGMDVGFERAGFKVLLANDIDPVACSTYRLNHTSNILQGSLLAFDLHKELAGQKIDLVFGGPPCQGFSIAGKMDPSDERSKLIQSFFDVVDLLGPKAFVCENVKALATLKKWRGVRDELLTRAKRGYRVAVVVLNASEFGVPQLRERMFLIGLRKDVFEGSDTDLQALIETGLAAETRTPRTIAEIFRELGRAGSVSNARTCAAKITFARSPIMRKSPFAGMLFNGAGRPLSPKRFAPTLPASMGGNKTPIIDEDEIFENKESYIESYHQHLMLGGLPYSGDADRRLRRLTIEECLAIQTFPDNYKLAGSRSAQYRQLGNAVPPLLAEAVARVLANMLFKNASSTLSAAA
ncbi:MAG: DNA (cytosine-5-)-methyltransferase [Alphaproteobacteria bacterium PA1]|nr:MAG: DNA (cytosine-5-)-methyltransferase [Alphaproteobacteria bacterium PA1]